MHPIDGTFTFLVCTRCSLGFIQPQPSDVLLARHYPETYYAYSGNDDAILPPEPSRNRQRVVGLVWRWTMGLPGRLGNRFVRSRRERQWYETLYTTVPPGRCLDIGCGQGLLLNELRARGWETFGCDISAQACERARRHGHQVFCGNIEDAPFSEDHFSLITLMHSIEHVRNPLETLRAVRRLLSPSGQVLIETPNIDSWLYCVFRNRYWAVDSPRHLFLFSPRSLKAAARMADLAIEDVFTHSSPRGIIFTWLYFLSDACHWPRDRFLLGRDAESTMQRSSRKIAADLLELPCLIVDLVGIGDSLHMRLRACHD